MAETRFWREFSKLSEEERKTFADRICEIAQQGINSPNAKAGLKLLNTLESLQSHPEITASPPVKSIVDFFVVEIRNIGIGEDVDQLVGDEVKAYAEAVIPQRVASTISTTNRNNARQRSAKEKEWVIEQWKAYRERTGSGGTKAEFARNLLDPSNKIKIPPLLKALPREDTIKNMWLRGL